MEILKKIFVGNGGETFWWLNTSMLFPTDDLIMNLLSDASVRLSSIKENININV